MKGGISMSLSGLFKAVIVATPVVALLLYYVVIQQGKLNVEMEKESIQFEQKWNEFRSESPFTANKQRYEERAKKTEEELEEIKKREKEKQKKIENFEEQFEKAMEEKGVK